MVRKQEIEKLQIRIYELKPKIEKLIAKINNSTKKDANYYILKGLLAEYMEIQNTINLYLR